MPARTRSPRRPTLIAAKPVGALLLLASAALALAPGALAGPPGKWTRVTSEPQPSNTREIGLERTADGVLHVLWTRDNGPTEQVLHSAIPLSAVGLVGPHALASTGNALNNSVDLVAGPGGGLRAFFSGIFPGSPLPGGYNTVMATATAPAAGTPWSAPTAASNNVPGTNSPVSSGSGIGAAVQSGMPISTWGDSSPSGGGFHLGINPSDPDIRYSTACCERDPNVGVDSVTGDAVLAMNLLAPAGNGIRVTGNVPAQIVPGSGARWTQQRVAVSGRIGAAGVFVAYGHGTNMFNARPALWRVGSAAAKVLKVPPDAEHTTLSPAPGGRLWVAWEGKDRGNRLFATRTNPAATSFGAIVSIRPPAGTQAIYRLNVEGSRAGFLDVLALVGRSGNDIAYWHQRLRPGLTLRAKPVKVKRGRRVTFRVLDAGAPIAGAKVVLKLGKKKLSRKTNGQGRAKIKIPLRTKPKRYPAVATKAGYVTGKRKIRVKK